MFKVNLFAKNQVSIFLKQSFVSASSLLKLGSEIKRLVSSGNNFNFWFGTAACISLIYTKNSKGSSTLLCGTPHGISLVFEDILLTTVNCCLLFQ